jgi:hypothetical protein
VGTRLFERAAIHCRNSDVDTLYMQRLASNRTMMHIAQKAGMEIRRERDEANAQALAGNQRLLARSGWG